jgi:hypothetical protein
MTGQTPKTPEPETIIELVDVVAWGPLILALVAGAIVGAAIVYIARGGFIVEDARDA